MRIDDDVLIAMTRCGGSFVQQLAVLIQRADDINRAKLLAAFPEYIEEYRRIAAQLSGARRSDT